MDKFLKSLGISTERHSLIDNTPTVKKSTIRPDYDNSRMGRPGNARDMLEFGLQKGSYGSENLKNTHGESWHSDNDKEVEKMVTTIDEVPLHEDGEHPKKLRVKDRMNRTKQELNVEDMLRSLTDEELFLKAFDEPPEPKDEADKELSADQKTDAQIDAQADRDAMGEDEDEDEDEEKSLSGVLTDLCKGFDFNKDKKIDSHEKHHKKIDEEHKKMKEDANKSDPLDDLVKACKKKDKPYRTMDAAPDLENLHENSDSVREIPAKKGFVKKSGPGGIIFDFGNMTGNPIADRFTSILQQNSEVQQNQIAADQRNEYEQALTGYVKKGEYQWGREQGNGDGVNPQADWNKQLNTPMDQQVANAFQKGQLSNANAASTPEFFDRNKFASEQIGLGGEVIKATSETDQQLIQEMKKAGLDRVFEGGTEIDTTNSGVTVDFDTGVAYDAQGHEIEASPTLVKSSEALVAPAEVLTAANF